MQPAGAAKMAFRTPVWGPVGDQTLKSTNLNWNTTQAQGAAICLELTKGVELGDFCNTGAPTCW